VQSWTQPQPGWDAGEHLWAAETRVVGQILPQAVQGVNDTPAGSGLQEAIEYMKQEVDDAQRIAQMMEVRATAHARTYSVLPGKVTGCCHAVLRLI